LGVLLDSTTASQDPRSLKKLLKKMSLTKLEDAMKEMNKKMVCKFCNLAPEKNLM